MILSESHPGDGAIAAIAMRPCNLGHPLDEPHAGVQKNSNLPHFAM